MISFHSQPVSIKGERDLARLEETPLGPNRIAVFTAHQMGGCRMGNDPARSVVDARLRHHAIENLFVVDGSVFPSSLAVNPQLTIMAFAQRAARHVYARLSGAVRRS